MLVTHVMVVCACERLRSQAADSHHPMGLQKGPLPGVLKGWIGAVMEDQLVE
jgi:hypothetical protein